MNPGRWILLTAFVVLLFNSGARFLMGLTLAPMSSDLGWSRTTLSSAVTVFMIVSASALPFVGKLVDRLGAQRVLVIGVSVAGTAIACLGLVRTPAELLLLYGVVFACGSAATSVTPIGVLVTRAYPERAGLANSVAIAGMGVGQLLIISVLAAELSRVGWRGAYALVGTTSIALTVPLLWFAARRWLPQPQSAAEHARKAQTEAPANAVAQVHSVRDALRSWRFCLLLGVYVICGFQDFFIATHIVAFALDEGLGTVLAGNMLAFMGLAGLAGVLLAGVLNDRYGPVVPTALNFAIRIALFTLVALSREPWVIVTAALLYGATFWMTAPLAVVFARLFCGFTLLGALSGLITMSHHIAGGVGALFGATVFDSLGSYQLAMWSMLGLSVLGLALSPLLTGGAKR